MKGLIPAIVALALLVGCGEQKPPPPKVDATPPPAGRTVPLSSYDRAQISVEGHKIDVYVADENAELTEGLMFVKDNELGPDEGMLFVFSTEAPLSFWMENTLIPLDIAFLDSKGKILNIRQMQPLDRTPQPSEGAAKYAVEMHVGWFEKMKIKAGDHFDLGGVS